MAGDRHDGFVELFARRPELVHALLGDAAAVIPAGGPVRVASNEFSHYRPTKYYADRVLIFGTGPNQVAVIIEIQRRYVSGKKRVWPFYVSSVWRTDGIPVVLFVLCDKTAVAEAYREPIRMGPAGTCWPTVIGPDGVPQVRDPQVARELPELAVISAAVHYRQPGGEEIFRALAVAMMTVGPELGRQYYDIAFSGIPKPRQAALKEVVMTTLTNPYRSEYNRTLYAQGAADGEAKGEAQAVLTVLDERGVVVPEGVRRQILACTDLTTLGTWLRRAVGATTIDDVLDA